MLCRRADGSLGRKNGPARVRLAPPADSPRGGHSGGSAEAHGFSRGQLTDARPDGSSGLGA